MASRNIIEELGKHPDGTFLDQIDFNDGSFGACRITGESPVWEKQLLLKD